MRSLLKRAEHLAQIHITQMHVDRRIYLFTLSLKPRGLCLHHIVGHKHSLVEPERCRAEILISFGEIGQSHIVCFQGFLRLECRLLHLQVHHLAGIL